MSKEKIVVSACLLGVHCRYDGAAKRDEALIDWLRDYEVIPFCPEDPAFGTPREKLYLQQEDDVYRVVRFCDQKDVTALLLKEIMPYTTLGAKRAILKSKSPSCGIGTTPIMNRLGETTGYGDGVAASLFKKVGIKLADESGYNIEKNKDE